MKFKKVILLLFFSLISTYALALPRCENLYNAIYNENERYDTNIQYIENQKSIGIKLKRQWDQNRSLKSKTDGKLFDWPGWIFPTNEEGYYIVGKLTDGFLSERIKINDVILSINDVDIRGIFKKEGETLFYENWAEDSMNISDKFEKNEKMKFELLRDVNGTKKKIIIDTQFKDLDVDYVLKSGVDPYLRNEIKSFEEPNIDFYINSIDINEREGFFNAAIETNFEQRIDERYFLTNSIWEHIVDDKVYEDSKLVGFYWEQCLFNDDIWHKLNSIDPAFSLKFDNLIKEDRQTRTSEYLIKPVYFSYEGSSEKGFTQDKASVSYKSTSFYTIKNSFNLKNFPFDKQQIKIFLYNDKLELEDFRAKVTKETMSRASMFKEKNNIEGWNIKEVRAQYELFKDPNSLDYYDGFSVILEVERKSGYYIFKIILPIVLILIVCWSAVWIDPKEIESRLTITIVCLLSLIAYNFVIDSELPKLEYLTIMDYIILISYVYAAIPNMLSIWSHNLIKSRKKLTAAKYEYYEKRFGLVSYLFIILLIIIVNGTNNPNHAGSLLAWLS